MMTFNDLTSGFNGGVKVYTGTLAEVTEAIKFSDIQTKFFIAFARNHPIDAKRIEVYLSPASLPNGWAEKGKIYEGNSKKQAVEALVNISK